ncbi:MAG: polysaccharide deacetylase family protein [Oscillospiraceae bacterium]
MKKIGKRRLMLAASAVFLAAITAIIAGAPPQAEPVSAEAPAEGKYVALTFDDGPSCATTGALLDGLKARGAKATFFVVGSCAEENESLLLRMAEEGHQIGQHTYSHVALRDESDWTILWEVRETDALLCRLLGEGDYWLRPPYGLVEERQYALIETPLITWSVDALDWKLLDAEKVTALVLSSVESGDIILMHDIYQSSVDAALRIVDALQAQGYEFVTVRQLMELYGVTPEPGELYRSPLLKGRGY